MSWTHFQLLPDLFCVFFPPSFFFLLLFFFFDGARIVFEVQECFKGICGGARCGRGSLLFSGFNCLLLLLQILYVSASSGWSRNGRLMRTNICGRPFCGVQVEFNPENPAEGQAGPLDY